jgi:5-methylcytosine-specific restriction endonuclease McrA
MKRCGRCKQRKDISAFNKAGHTKDGLQGYCRECMHEYQGYKRLGRGRPKKETRVCTRCNEEKSIEEFTNTSRICKACKKPKGGSKPGRTLTPRKRKTKEEKAAMRRERYHKVKDNARVKALRKEADRRYRAAHPEIQKASKQNRRARSKGRFTANEWKELKAVYNYRCLCCGEIEPRILLSVDHVIPLVKGGSNTIDNIQPLCVSCNSKKGTKTTDYRP